MALEGGYTPRAGYSDTMLKVTLSVLNQLQTHCRFCADVHEVECAKG